MSDSSLNSKTWPLLKTWPILKPWIEGIVEFNQGRYWHAHERWEIGWKDLKSPEKIYIQSLIQVCGIFHLMRQHQRYAAALSLCQSSLTKLRSSRIYIETPCAHPRLIIIHQEQILKDLIRLFSSPKVLNEINWQTYFNPYKAALMDPI